MLAKPLEEKRTRCDTVGRLKTKRLTRINALPEKNHPRAKEERTEDRRRTVARCSRFIKAAVYRLCDGIVDTGSAIGNWIITCNPCPSGGDASVTVASSESQISLTMAMPRPDPPALDSSTR